MSVRAPLELDELRTAIHQALGAWDQIGGTEEDLLGFLLLVQDRRSKLESQSPAALRGATNEVLAEGIATLAERNETGARVLEARFEEGQTTRWVAARLHAGPDQVNRWQRAAISSLTEILFSQEMALRQKQIQQMETALPARPYTQLFGFDQVKQEVVDHLLAPGPPWALVIGGIGGIGKTSLADAVARQAIQALAFSRVLWLRAAAKRLSGTALPPEQSYRELVINLAHQLWPEAPGSEAFEERLARVRRALKAEPHLVVVDNLENAAETAYLLEQFREFQEPTRFVFTSRARPGTAADAYQVSLDELPLEDATDLVQHHAEIIGLSERGKLAAGEIEQIYAAVGGNPLALKLVVGLAAVLPLNQVLAALDRSQPGPVEELYLYIYRQAWRSLSPEAKTLLQAMPLVAEPGALPEQVQAMSQLSDVDFWQAVSELVRRSLLEVRGTVLERRYGIHRLTETFLHTEIIRLLDEEE